MGGMLVVLVVMFLAMALRIDSSVTLTPMLALVGVGILGAVDDFVNARTGIGMRGRWKLVWQTVVALLAAFYIQRHFDITVLNVPFLGEIVVGAVFFALFMAFVIVGVSNAVNLTDGLDGLAAGVLIFCFVTYLLIALVDPPGDPGPLPNLAIFCALIVGALMGFLWFNVHPAQIFMGDSGALGLGATLAVVATMSRQLPLLAIVGVVFFAVIMSVVLQVVSFRLRGRRIFRMAPLQHHFELIGWAEEKITVRFWIVSALAGLLGFSVFLATTTGVQSGPMTTMTAPIASTADLRGRRAVVLGLARSGAAAARMLSDAGAEVTVYDRLGRVRAVGRGGEPRWPVDRAGPGGRSCRGARPAGRRRAGDHQPVDLGHLPDHRCMAARRASAGRGCRSAGHRRGRSLPALDAGPRAGDDRHQGQDDHHRADRRDAGGGRPAALRWEATSAAR